MDIMLKKPKAKTSQRARFGKVKIQAQFWGT